MYLCILTYSAISQRAKNGTMSSGRRVFLLAVLQLLAPATPTFAQGKLKLSCEFHKLVFGRESKDLGISKFKCDEGDCWLEVQ